jgi:hypothetical protein
MGGTHGSALAGLLALIGQGRTSPLIYRGAGQQVRHRHHGGFTRGTGHPNKRALRKAERQNRVRGRR